MHIGLLQCDDVNPALIERHGNYPAMFQALLTRSDPDIRLSVWRCLDGEFPEQLDACDGWLITGSKHGVNDGLAWITTLCEFVRRVHAAKLPLVGVCFGHQVIARALGGEVEKHARGWGVGLSFNRVCAQRPWMQPPQAGLDLIVSHQDQVSVLPADARVLADSAFCAFYLIEVGSCLGVQGHPEFSPAYSRDLMRLRREQIGEHRVREGEASLSVAPDSAVMTQWMLAFIRHWR